MKGKYCFSVVVLAVIGGLAGIALSASTKPMTVAELALYNGADRQQLLEEGAKKEGALLFYTTGILKQAVRPVVDAFQKKYPYIKVDIWRGETNNLVSRVFEEYKAGRSLADVIEVTQTGEIVLEEGGLLQSYSSPNLNQIEEGTIKNATGGGAFSAGHYQSGIGLGYNAKRITKAQVPKTYQDFLDQKWKGKVAMVSGNTGVSWMGTVLETFGEQFVEKVAKQNFSVHAVSAMALLDMIINGEYDFAPTIMDSHVINAKKRGAPVEWVPIEPTPMYVGQIMLPKQTLHPYAAMLYIDFDLSKQAGEIYKANGYVSPRKDIAGERMYKKHYGPQSSKQVENWNKVFNKYFLQK